MHDQQQAEIHAQAANLLLGAGRLAEGAEELRLCIECAPFDVAVRQRRADTLVQLGRVPEAIEELQHVAGHFAAAGRPFQAMAVNLVILELDPDHVETQGALADLFADRRSEPLPIVPKLPSSMSGALGKSLGDDEDEEVHTGSHHPPARAPVPYDQEETLQTAPVRPAREVAPHPHTHHPVPAAIQREVELEHSTTRPDPRPPRSQAGGPGAAPLVLQVGGLLRRATALPKPNRGGILSARPLPQPAAREVALNVGALNRTPLFSSLGRNAFVALLSEVELRFVNAGQVIVEEGAPGASMFVVVEGQVDVVRSRAPDGRTLVGSDRSLVAQLGQGAFFGEMALFANSLRLATVLAVTDVLLLEIDRDALDSVAAAHPSVTEVLRAFYRARLLDNLLQQSPLFREFTADQKRALGEKFRHFSLPKGAVLVTQGQPSTGLCVLLRGRASAIHTSTSGHTLPPQPLREGDVFGEISLLFGAPAVATVHADSPVEVLELPREYFEKLVLSHPSVRAQIEEQARERLERMREGLAARGEWVSSGLV
jgi:CRP-like cAMP-binding protein